MSARRLISQRPARLVAAARRLFDFALRPGCDFLLGAARLVGLLLACVTARALLFFACLFNKAAPAAPKPVTIASPSSPRGIGLLLHTSR